MASQSDSDSESDSRERTVKKPTASEIFFSPEERQFRRQYRMIKSEFCLQELWKFYNKLVARYTPAEEALPDIEDDVVNYSMMNFDFTDDPTEEMRYDYMAKKYRYLLDGIAYLIHCPEKPYLLMQKSRELDCPGRKLVLPKAIKNTRPEVHATTAPPFEGTVAYTKKWMNVSNLNFEVIRARFQEHSQTEPWELLQTEIIPARRSLWDAERDDIQVDLFDIPLDTDGNPIGKRTGYCEWCKKEILPIPTPHVLATTWERRTLYCCAKYRQLVEEIVDFERQQLREEVQKNMIVDVRHKMKPEQLRSLDPELAEQIMKKQMEAPRLSLLGKYVREAVLQDKESRATLRGHERYDMSLDTTDVPWDPYETRLVKLPPFKNVPFDDSMERFYLHAEVLLTQTEMYSAHHMYADLGDLASSAQKAEQPPSPADVRKASSSL